MAHSPTGEMHAVPLADLFFSTTDAKGIIDEANEVFSRNARYPRERLIGAPHNIIRHPDMPGAVFAVMWDMLQAGKPVCAYVLNLAGDGSAYWAFATIVPVGNRYLSVRSTPSNIDARDLLHGLYTSVRQAELQARKNGATAKDAALLGAKLLGEALVENGFDSYEDFMLDLVPVEVAARDAAGPPLPPLDSSRPELQAMTADAQEVRGVLSALIDTVSASLSDTDALNRELRRGENALRALGSAVTTAQSASGSDADQSLATGIAALREQATSASAALKQVSAALKRVVHTRKNLILGGVIARLHAEAIIRYIGAVAAGTEDPRVSERAMASLTSALSAILDADINADSEATRAFEPSVDQALSALDALQATGDSWSHAEREAAADAAAINEVALGLDAVANARQRIDKGASPVRGTGAALDRAVLDATLSRITEQAKRI